MEMNSTTQSISFEQGDTCDVFLTLTEIPQGLDQVNELSRGAGMSWHVDVRQLVEQ